MYFPVLFSFMGVALAASNAAATPAHSAARYTTLGSEGEREDGMIALEQPIQGLKKRLRVSPYPRAALFLFSLATALAVVFLALKCYSALRLDTRNADSTKRRLAVGGTGGSGDDKNPCEGEDNDSDSSSSHTGLTSDTDSDDTDSDDDLPQQLVFSDESSASSSELTGTSTEDSSTGEDEDPEIQKQLDNLREHREKIKEEMAKLTVEEQLEQLEKARKELKQMSGVSTKQLNAEALARVEKIAELRRQVKALKQVLGHRWIDMKKARRKARDLERLKRVLDKQEKREQRDQEKAEARKARRERREQRAQKRKAGKVDAAQLVAEELVKSWQKEAEEKKKEAEELALFQEAQEFQADDDVRRLNMGKRI